MHLNQLREMRVNVEWIVTNGVGAIVIGWILKRQWDIKKEIREEYLSKDMHKISCENAALRMREHISAEMKIAKGEIIAAIKNNGKGVVGS